MTRNLAEFAVLEAWHRVPPERRKTEQDAVVFAFRIIKEVHVASSGDPYQLVKSWLMEDRRMGFH